jgi:hypothetical protein
MPVFNRIWLDPTGKPNPADLFTRGPALQVEVSVPNILAAALTASSTPLPTPQIGTALIDTGASISAVDVGILQSLGLNPVSTTPVMTPAGVQMQGVYVVRLAFPGTPIQPQDPRPVIGSQLAGFGHVALLGRDLLLGALLIYDGVHGNWTIAF